MTRRSTATLAGAAAVALTLAAGHLGAHDAVPSRREFLTFRSAVALPGIQLVPGTYEFELADPDSGIVIRVRNRSTRMVVFQGFTRRVERPAMHRDSRVLFGEARKGEPPPVLVWYPVDQELGYQFIYR